VKISGWGGIDEARREIREAVDRYSEAPEKPNF
jgi:inorganic pyrophosphatase